MVADGLDAIWMEVVADWRDVIPTKVVADGRVVIWIAWLLMGGLLY